MKEDRVDKGYAQVLEGKIVPGHTKGKKNGMSFHSPISFLEKVTEGW